MDIGLVYPQIELGGRPEALRGFALAAGGTHASVTTMGHRFTDVEQHVDYIASVAEALGR